MEKKCCKHATAFSSALPKPQPFFALPQSSERHSKANNHFGLRRHNFSFSLFPDYLSLPCSSEEEEEEWKRESSNCVKGKSRKKRWKREIGVMVKLPPGQSFVSQ